MVSTLNWGHGGLIRQVVSHDGDAKKTIIMASIDGRERERERAMFCLRGRERKGKVSDDQRIMRWGGR